MNKVDVSALIRGSIIVRDLEKATTFYRALGLSETYFEGVLDDPSATSLLGFEEHHPFSIRILKRPGPNYGMVGLFELDAAQAAESLPPAAGPARIGEVALVFYVRSMDEALTALREAGATWSPEPQIFRMEHRAQPEVCLRDPDGVLINLVENDPAEQERTRPELSYRD
ncbi:VOC family protein [Sphingobium boeckii]|uniref:Catechol 2,3-dioxygenase-like lactoylglutathione lyase family enzyme n=1 Tax=Sphingobium boeckii TaxID=1082345 RepID=A0A7W9ALH2_9SPHN|nr:VOC family protein [Sphingobium boeckii]MBB5687718.1 catechol 2,3-dioxygenase-like lactoylglutathione lyase family enzyme [Sphingobium boeckii]